MTMTAAAQWLNTAFAGYDEAILKIMHSLSGALGSVLTPLMKLITFLGEKGLLLLLLSLAFDTLTKNSLAAVILFAVFEAVLIALRVLVPDLLAGSFPAVMNRLSVFDVFTGFAGGLFDLGSVVYYLSIIGVFVFLTVQSLEKRRWS